jgi:hypothetical protein
VSETVKVMNSAIELAWKACDGMEKRALAAESKVKTLEEDVASLTAQVKMWQRLSEVYQKIVTLWLKPPDHLFPLFPFPLTFIPSSSSPPPLPHQAAAPQVEGPVGEGTE